MSAKRSRSTDFFDQREEGLFEPVVDTPRSKFVPIENVPGGDLNPEQICILCEELRKVNDPALAEAVEELLATHTSHPVPARDEDGSAFPPIDSDEVLVAKIKADVKPQRNPRPSPTTIAMASMLLVGLGGYDMFIVEFDEE